VRRRQDIVIAFRQDNSSASASDTVSGTLSASVATLSDTFQPTQSASSDGSSSSSQADGSSRASASQESTTSPSDTTSVVQSTPSSTSSSTSSTTQLSTSSTTISSTSPPSSSSSPTSSSSQQPSSSSSSSSSASASSSSSSSSSSYSSGSTSSVSSTSSGSSSATTPPPSSSSSTSGRETTIGTSTIVQTVNGQVTTAFEPIVTTMSDSGSDGLSPTANKGIIAGSVVGVCALLTLAFAMVVFYRRHRHKKLDFFKRKQPKPRNMLLAGEDLDDLDMGPPMASYRDYPGSMVSHSASPSIAGHNASRSISGSPMNPQASYSRVHIPGTPMSSPHLMGMRTSEAGSIFQEQVWPPPRTAFVDPLVSTDDLTRIVDDVMGPRDANGMHAPTSFRTDSRLRGGHESTTSLDSAPDMPDAGGRHGRTPSQTTLLPPASPQTPTWRTPLFVTNMGSETPSIYSLQSPPLGASRHLSSEAEQRQPLSTEGEPMGEAL